MPCGSSISSEIVVGAAPPTRTLNAIRSAPMASIPQKRPMCHTTWPAHRFIRCLSCSVVQLRSDSVPDPLHTAARPTLP